MDQEPSCISSCTNRHNELSILVDSIPSPLIDSSSVEVRSNPVVSYSGIYLKPLCYYFNANQEHI